MGFSMYSMCALYSLLPVPQQPMTKYSYIYLMHLNQLRPLVWIITEISTVLEVWLPPLQRNNFSAQNYSLWLMKCAFQYSLVPCKKCVIFSQDSAKRLRLLLYWVIWGLSRREREGKKRSHTICNQWAGNCTEPQTPMGPESLSHLLLSW